MVPAFPVLGFVVEGLRLDFHLSGGEIPLEVGAVVHGIPEAEFYIGKQFEMPRPVPLVLNRQFQQHTPVFPGDQHGLFQGKAVFCSRDHRVAQAVAAAVEIQGRLGGLPAGIPNTALLRADIHMEAVGIQGAAVVAVAGDPPQSGILIEAVASRRIGHQGEEVLAAQIVDPGQGRGGRGDHIFPLFVIKMAVLHMVPPCI